MASAVLLRDGSDLALARDLLRQAGDDYLQGLPEGEADKARAALGESLARISDRFGIFFPIAPGEGATAAGSPPPPSPLSYSAAPSRPPAFVPLPPLPSDAEVEALEAATRRASERVLERRAEAPIRIATALRKAGLGGGEGEGEGAAAAGTAGDGTGEEADAGHTGPPVDERGTAEAGSLPEPARATEVPSAPPASPSAEPTCPSEDACALAQLQAAPEPSDRPEHLLAALQGAASAMPALHARAEAVAGKLLRVIEAVECASEDEPPNTVKRVLEDRRGAAAGGPDSAAEGDSAADATRRRLLLAADEATV